MIKRLLKKHTYKSKPISLIMHIMTNTDIANQCWNWCGAKNGDGYGSIGFDGEIYVVTRIIARVAFAYLDFKDSMLICHTCDNPSCINPRHLFIGTHKDNFNDMVKKGRQTSNKKRESPDEVDLLYLKHREAGLGRTEAARLSGRSRSYAFSVESRYIPYWLKRGTLNLHKQVQTQGELK